MSRIDLTKLPEQELVDLFIEICTAQYWASLHFETAKYNRLFGRMVAVEKELASRGDNGIGALLPALDHPNSQVRYMAAHSLIPVAPDVAIKTLEDISENGELDQRMLARGTLRALEEGRYKSSIQNIQS